MYIRSHTFANSFTYICTLVHIHLHTFIYITFVMHPVPPHLPPELWTLIALKTLTWIDAKIVSRICASSYAARSDIIATRLVAMYGHEGALRKAIERCPPKASYSAAIDKIIAEMVQAGGGRVHAVDAATGKTALMLAAAKGHDRVVACLIGAPNVNVNQPDRDGKTALMLAAAHGHDRAVACLIGAPNVNVNQPDNGGKTALMLAAAKGHGVVVACLIGAPNINVNQPDNGGKTALMLAVVEGHGAVVTRLVVAPGVNVNAADNYGFTSLMMATIKGNEAVVALLVPYV